MRESKEIEKTLHALREMERMINKNFREREEVVRAVVLALLSGEHLYLIGPPGTGKSQLIRMAASRFPALVYVERLLHQESDRKSLQSPFPGNPGIGEGAIIFLDEILRAPRSLLLTLLSFMNERIWHDPEPRPAPLVSLFAASNAHPSQSDHLEAFFDRFALRCLVEPVRHFESFSDLLEDQVVFPERSTGEARETIKSFKDLHRVISREVLLDPEVVKKLWDLRHRLGREGISLSDRRWKMVVKVLKAIAFYEGSERVEQKHMSGLLPVLWTYPPEIRTIRRILSSG